MKRGTIEIYIACLLVALFIQAGCSPRIGRNVLSFFFDGVPQHDSQSIEEADNVPVSDETFRATAIMSDKASVVHYPYEQKECLLCHDENNMSELVAKPPELCYMCHDDFQTVFKYVHGPVAAGYCLECHNAHMSGEKSLLTRSGQEVCTLCHTLKDVIKSDTHMEIEDTECMLCHNPHGGEDRFILN